MPLYTFSDVPITKLPQGTLVTTTAQGTVTAGPDSYYFLLGEISFLLSGSELLASGGSFITQAPVITGDTLPSGATSVSGTTPESDGTLIGLFVNESQVGTTVSVDHAWTVTFTPALEAGDLVAALALAPEVGAIGSEDSGNHEAIQTDTPVIDTPLADGATSVSGTSSEADGCVVTVYVDSVSRGNATVASGVWALTGIVDTLDTGEIVTATAFTGGKGPSEVADPVTVLALTAVPTITTPVADGDTHVAGTCNEANGTTVEVFVDNVSKGTTTVTSHAWDKTGLVALVAAQVVKARAVAVGKAPSAYSIPVTVTA